MIRHRIIFTLLLLVSSIGCSAQPASAHQIEIQSAWIRATSAMNMEDGEMSEDEMEGHSGSSTSAAYMVINNRGRQADKLLSITSDAAESAEMHLSQTKNDITSMKMVTEIMIPPKGKTELKPGSYHIMLIRLKHNLHPGDEVILKLHFEKSGEIEIAAEVREP